jgi:alginate O-acetyltransferase complex protein AlgJ
MSVLSDTKSGELTAVRHSAMIGHKTALCLIVLFAVLIVIPPIHQFCVELKRTGRWRFLVLFQETPTHASLKRFEETLASESDLAARARKLYQAWLLRWLGQGNDKIVVGRDGFLFFRTEVEMAAGPGFLQRRVIRQRGTQDASKRESRSSALDIIVDFDRQLRARGIHLVFVPLPVKPSIYPEEVWPGYPTSAGPACNRDRAAFKARLTDGGVDVLDVTDDLWQAKARAAGKLFLKLDTHWTPQGLSVVADRLAAHVKPHLPGPAQLALTTRSQTVTNFGDLLRMLEVRAGSAVFSPQTVEIVQVLDSDKLAEGDDSAPVLLLGDSFANIYHRKELEWGEGAGLGEQLMLRLGVGVQVIAINGGAATAVREALAQKPGALSRKKVVVWTCSVRDFFDEAVAWEPVPLPGEQR